MTTPTAITSPAPAPAPKKATPKKAKAKTKPKAKAKPTKKVSKTAPRADGLRTKQLKVTGVHRPTTMMRVPVEFANMVNAEAKKGKMDRTDVMRQIALDYNAA